MTQRTIRNLITRREVVLLPPNASVRDASQLMAQQHVGAILVMVDDQLEGIFSERDALKRVLAEGRDPDATQLSEVMTKDVVTLGPDAWALDALRLMRDIGFRHLPVVEQDLVIGVISLRDFVGAELQQVG
ncbi:MAG: cyclic nucleotide-binding/CBS domain-containing protein, partial [Acidiferrobacterales bacterium]